MTLAFGYDTDMLKRFFEPTRTEYSFILIHTYIHKQIEFHVISLGYDYDKTIQNACNVLKHVRYFLSIPWLPF